MGIYNKLAKILPNSIQKKLENNYEIQKIITNIIWVFGERGIQFLLAIFIGVLLARYLEPNQFGIYSFGVAFVSIFSIFSQLGLNGILTRDLVQNSDNNDEILGTAFILRLMGCLINLIVGLITIILLRPNDLEVQLFIFLLLISNLFDAFRVISCWFEAKVLSKYVFIGNSVSLLIYYGLNLIFVILKFPLIAFAISSIIQSVFNVIFLILSYENFHNKILNWQFNFTQAKNLLSQSWSLILSSFGAIIYLKIDQLMLSQMTTDTIVGIYSVAVRLSEVWYFIPIAIVSSFFPSLLKAKAQGIEIYHSKLQKIYDLLVYIALILAIPITFLGTPFIKLLYGDAYEEAGQILSIHIWASVFIFMRSLLSKWLIAENLFVFSFVTHTSGAVVNILLNLILIPQLGGIGAAIATLISYATASYFSLFLNSKTWDMAMIMTKALIVPIRNINSLITKKNL